MKSSVITSGTDLLWTILVEAVRYRLYKWRLPGSGAKK
jgi:hypothetical protein